jgi:hypothetical protein
VIGAVAAKNGMKPDWTDLWQWMSRNDHSGWDAETIQDFLNCPVCAYQTDQAALLAI